MIAAIATIAFLAAAWAAIVAIAGSLDDSLGKVSAALRGVAPSPQPQLAALRFSSRHPQGRAQRAEGRPVLRAAA
ncbi:hypothetical protein [Sphingomonas sp.]|uniref:hypothetical protein n=1 Tax=Sphingomonas sp. TaxID=28214 RepID=UPI00286C0C66|nr:hypothetical protein [Sphingomonas sp.]